VVAALRGLGVEAEEGEVEAEFCPGAYSVRSGGERGIKAAGLAQRVTRRAARVEALILVSSTEGIRSALSSLYPALGMNFRPEGVGDLAGSTGPLSVQEVAAALTKELEESYGAARADTDDRLLSRAVELRGSWRASS
jgi:lipoate-protein ligase A